MEQAYAARVEPEVLTFEHNAQLWRLEIDRHVLRLRENSAFGLDDPEERKAAEVALEGLSFEIDRFQAFAKSHPQPPLEYLVRLSEVGVALQTARLRISRALE